MRNQPIISRFASLGLAGVLLMLSGFIVDTSFATRQAVVHARNAVSFVHYPDGVARLVVLRQLAQIDHLQSQIIGVTAVVFVLGMLLIALFAAVMTAAGRRAAESTEAELMRLERMSLTDHLTQLGNHRAFQEEFRRISERARETNKPLTLALVDVDEFKEINDENGHAHGDSVLREIAQLLREVCGGEFAFRLGGDEFALLFPLHINDAPDRLEELRSQTESRLYPITVSIGFAERNQQDESEATVQECADAALYEAKRRGRNGVVDYEEIKDDAVILSSEKAHNLRRLLTGQQVEIVFQPIWDIDRGVILSYEALMRPSPEYGFSGPQEAFDLAETLGHAHELDLICRNAILKEAAKLPPCAVLFINISPQSLDQEFMRGTNLLQDVLNAGLTPDRVVLEITERSLARLSVVVREAKRLQSLGFKIALDDAGSGNAGLEMLSYLTADYIKIDRQVVAKARTDKSARAVFAGIVAIAHETNTYVIAEGIEDEEMLRLVRNAGTAESEIHLPYAHRGGSVNGVQGYLLGRPSAHLPSAPSISTYHDLLTGEDKPLSFLPVPLPVAA